MTLDSRYQVHLMNSILNPAKWEAEMQNIGAAVLNESLNGQESLRFTLKLGDPLVASISMSKSQVLVSRNNTIIWWGIVTGMDSESATLVYTAQDLSWLFTKRYIAPIVKKPFYSTRFQRLSAGNTARRTPLPFPNQFAPGANARAQSVVGPTNYWAYYSWLAGAVGSNNGADGGWYVALHGDNSDIFWNSAQGAFFGRAYDGGGKVNDPGFGSYPSTVTGDPVQSPDIAVVRTSTVPVRNDLNGVPVVPFEGNDYLTYINWGGGSPSIDTAGNLPSYNSGSVLGGRFFRRFTNLLANNTTYAKDVHCVVYLRLSGNPAMDPFSSLTPTLANAQAFNINQPATQGTFEPMKSIVEFGLMDMSVTSTQSDAPPMGWTSVATADTSGLPASQWVRIVLTVSIPPNTADVPLAVQFNATGQPGYILGGVDIFVDDGLFYTSVDQATIVSNLIAYAQDSANGWQPLNILTSIPGTPEKRSKAYLFSDYTTLYDALWEYTTLLGGYDFAWTYAKVGANIRKQFNAYYAPPAPGTAVGASLGRGTVKETVLASGAEILDYQVAQDGTMLSDVVGVYEPTTDSVSGAARDFQSVSAVPADRWQLATIYEGTPGNNTLTLKSQAQRGYNRYSNNAVALDLTLHPDYTDNLFTSVFMGDVINVTIPELGLTNVQFRIVGRTINLETDIVTLTVAQYYGV